MDRRTFLLRSAAWAGAGLWGPGLMRGKGLPSAGEAPGPNWIGQAAGGIVGVPLAPRSGPRGATMFRTMPPEETGIVTVNNYADAGPGSSAYRDPRMWADRFHVFEVGAIGTGVAIGDYDGDGRPDLFVVSKTESCRLFRNLGNWRFEDVTERAGVGDQGAAAGIWKQGASWVDINNDGWLDLYVCRFNAPNLLYLNQGDGTFREMGHAYGLDVVDASVMGAFCDYDRDGWLDLYLVTNLLDAARRPNGQRDYLFHNNRDGTFSDVTERAGIGGEGQGHAATWWDYDHDGWPDLYVSNDFEAPDKLYHNNRDGTFTDVIDRVVPHMPFSSMGSDLGDVNNDGRIDFLAADMAATTHEKDQRGMASLRSQMADPPNGSGQAPQYPRSALYLNTGTGHCQEAAFLAGLEATDWTWSPRWEDLDNDGRLDLFVPNGMHREVHNTDLIQRLMLAESPGEKVRIERSSPVLVEGHLAYRNLGELRFENVSAAWGLNEQGVSFGAAFGDLDGDGDLDLVYSNYQKGVTVLRNDCPSGHRVIFALRGSQSNRFGVGALVRIETPAGMQVRYLTLARGVLSSSEPVLHFGLGEEERIERVTIEWPSGCRQVFEDLAADQRYTVREPAEPKAEPRALPGPPPGQFAEVSAAVGFSLSSREEPIDELAQQPLLPLRQNRRGPALAVGDLDGDGVEEVVMGGTPRDPARVLKVDPAGVFRAMASSVLGTESPLNDGPVLVFDADGDGVNDLLLTKAGVARPAGSAEYQPRLFLNDGRGGFRAAPEGSLPLLPISAGAVAAADFDRDGRLDLFLGGRVLPGLYPLSPKSALWVNRGGRFEDVTDTLAPGLREVGMVTSALWSDVDGDGWVDLLLAVEWGTVKYFHNEQGRGFSDWSERAGFAAAGPGWWSSIAAGDFNGDGRLDYVVGNLGLNTQYRADAQHPALLFAGDFNGDGGMELVEGYYEGERLYPWRTRKDLGAAIPAVLRRFPRNDVYARATLEEILGQEKLAAAQRYAATEFRSGVFLSQPDGTFRFEPLPRMAQLSPLQGMVVGDFDGDGHPDLYAVQNSFAPIPAVGRFDGGLSQLLRGEGRGRFTVIPPLESGLVVPGDAKALAVLDLDQDGWPDFLVTRNNDTTLAFRNRGVPGHHPLRIALRGPPGNPTGIGAQIAVGMADGTTQLAEVAAGSGFASQSGAACFFGSPAANPAKTVRVRWPGGTPSEHPVPAGTTKLDLSAEPS